MIRYRSAGVSATLLAADLDGSLSKSVTLQMGKEQGLDDKRVEEVLAAGTALSSRPIGADETERGVLQFIGPAGDIPFMMTEASLESTRISLEPPQQQALRLVVDTSEQAHFGRRKATETYVKIEVLLNGDFQDSFYFNPKKSGMINEYKLNGTRIQRQIEKPWTYQPSSGLRPSSLTAEERWSRVSESLRTEVRLRGTNQRGDLSPAGIFFQALAQVPLPSRLQEKAHLSIIDIIVVSGKGGKDGPSDGYIARPTRLRSVGYGSSEPVNIPAQLDPPVLGQLFNVATQRDNVDDKDTPSIRRDSVAAALPLRLPSQATVNGQRTPAGGTTTFTGTVAHGDDPFADGPAIASLPSSSAYTAPVLRSSSSDIPLATVPRSTPKLKLKFNTIPQPQPRPQSERKLTLGEQNAKEFAERHGIPYDPDAKVDSFKGRRGKEGGRRMVTQRIADIKKMTPSHQRQAIQQLKDELGQTLPTARPSQITPAKPSRLVKLPLPSGAFTPKPKPAAATMSAPQPIRSSRRHRSISDAQIHNSPSVATRTPRPRPRDGLLGSSVQTPVQNTPVITASTKKSSHRPGKLDDQTPEEALANFRLPEMCQGSVVSYAGGDASRQIPKTRPGYFEEDEFIVGMRFVVI